MVDFQLANAVSRGLQFFNAHPVGCDALVAAQRDRARAAFPEPLPLAVGKTALVLGSTSFGYGSATIQALLEAGFGSVVGVGVARAPEFAKGFIPYKSDPAWFVVRGMHQRDPRLTTFLGDAFADATRAAVANYLRERGTKVDLVVYSLAARSRTYGGRTWNSSLKVLGEPLDLVNVDVRAEQGVSLRVDVATPDEAEGTRRVMGGEDLALWVTGLLSQGLLAERAMIRALSYIGPDFGPLRRIYWDGSIGGAKKDIDRKMQVLNPLLAEMVGGSALSEMRPAVVTQASVILPGIVSYLAAFLALAEEGVGRYLDPLDVGIKFVRSLYGPDEAWREMNDEAGRARLDQEELEPGLQAALQESWRTFHPGPLEGRTARGFALFKGHYARLYGFEVPGVEYERAYPEEVWLPKLTPEMGVFDLTVAGNAALAVGSASGPKNPVVEHFRKTVGTGPKLTVVRTGNSSVELSRDLVGRLAGMPGNDLGVSEGHVSPEALFVVTQPAVFAAIWDDYLSKGLMPIHVFQQDQLYRPLTAGEKLTLSVKASPKPANPMMYDVSGEFKDAGGEVVASTQTVLYFSESLASGQAPARLDVSGLRPLPVTLEVTDQVIDEYMAVSGDDNPVHAGASQAGGQEPAQSLGLRRRILHGMRVVNLAATAETVYLREQGGSRDTGLWQTEFKGVVYPGDTLRTFMEPTKDGLKIQVVNQKDELVLTRTRKNLPREVAV